MNENGRQLTSEELIKYIKGEFYEVPHHEP